MENFRERIKADSDTMERINAISKEYAKQRKKI